MYLVTKSLTSIRFYFITLCVFVSACAHEDLGHHGSTTAEPSVIEVTLLQMNDVYEIEPLSKGSVAGLARVAYLLRDLERHDPNTLAILAGDFLSPSAIGTAKVQGQRLHGQHMVAVLNALGLDLATFGNHEFDLSEDELLARLQEAKFQWLATNVKRNNGVEWPGTTPYTIIPVIGPHGDQLRVGFFSITIQELSDKAKTYTSIENYAIATQQALEYLQPRADVIVAMTHLDVVDDQLLVEQFPDIDLVVGGHDHTNRLLHRGANHTPIAKADANAKSVYIHRIRYTPSSKNISITSEYVPIDSRMGSDMLTTQEVEKWVEVAFKAFEAQGFVPREPVAELPRMLDGRESTVRFQQAELGAIIADALQVEAEAQLGVFNSGSIRIDDVLDVGVITQYDVLRILPYEGEVVQLKVQGDMLEQLLTRGRGLKDTGAFLQLSANLSRQHGHWEIDGNVVDPKQIYIVATNDYLAEGKQKGLEFFKAGGDDRIELQAINGDMRLAVIKELKRKFPFKALPSMSPSQEAEGSHLLDLPCSVVTT
ncbi:MAG: bifunctional metallophosphatase/5'-nucleotidase [Nitrospirae bacterium]|nr:bifunctional metallophosphatase/5'-nucleotidase [Nitrospirota bacterium]MDA1303269.1 bifunctional metallophosphatase/5'-nucleotidase [Nitrospirota bacterium]